MTSCTNCGESMVCSRIDRGCSSCRCELRGEGDGRRRAVSESARGCGGVIDEREDAGPGAIPDTAAAADVFPHECGHARACWRTFCGATQKRRLQRVPTGHDRPQCHDLHPPVTVAAQPCCYRFDEMVAPQQAHGSLHRPPALPANSQPPALVRSSTSSQSAVLAVLLAPPLLLTPTADAPSASRSSSRPDRKRPFLHEGDPVAIMTRVGG